MGSADVSIRSRIFLTLLMIALLATTACNRIGNLTPEQHIQKAKEFQTKGDLRASIIELKNALQQKPDNAEARFLLGQNYVKTQLGSDAEKELLQAQRLGIPRATILPVLIKAYLLQGNLDKVLAESSIIPLASPVADQAEILSLRGQAYALKGKTELAEQELQKALKIKSDSNPAHVGMAILHANKNDLVNAKKELELATKADPKAPEAWSILGDIELRQGRLTEAEKAFSQAILARKFVSLELARRALTRIELKKYKEAQDDIDILNKEGWKDHPYVSYVKGVANFSQNKYTDAQTFFESSYAKNPQFPPVLMYLATTHLRLGHSEQALSLAKKMNTEVPNSPFALRLIGAIQASRAEYGNARKVLQEILKQSPNDVNTLNMLASISLRENNVSDAMTFALKALSLEPKSQQANNILTSAKLMAGETLDENNASGDLYTQKLLIALSSFKQRKVNESLAMAEKLHEQYPDKIDPLNLMAASHFALRQWEKAKAPLEAALKIKPDNDSALRNLAIAEFNLGNPKRAISLLQPYVKTHPKNSSAALILANALTRTGNRVESLKVLELSAQNNPKDMLILSRLATTYLEAGLVNKVLEITKNLRDDQLLQHTELLESQAKALMLSGNPIAARNAFEKLVKQFPNSATAHYFLADSLAITSEFERANQELARSIQLDPKFLPARVAEIEALAHKNKLNEAKISLVKLREDFGNRHEVLGLEGWFALGTKDYTSAEKNLTAAFNLSPNQKYLTQLSRSQRLQNKSELAIKTLQNWLKDHPNDVVVLFSLAETYLNLDKKDDAIRTYAQILKLQPNSVQALNDYAWLSQDIDLKQAISYAQHAYQLAPDNPLVMDTLGMLTLKAGDTAGAANLLQKAAARATDYPQLQLHWGDFLVKQKRFSEARQTLEALIKKAPGTQPAESATTLLNSLPSKK